MLAAKRQQDSEEWRNPAGQVSRELGQECFFQKLSPQLR